ncbi:MAG: trypsin-like peptidase domain-containing protein, partial [Gemmatimonadota bacterium]|nr:trypsin-like peptidase domain-containing protein [Gemmatimonadota bacterium]
EDLPVAPLGESDDLLIGEWAIAIGNPFGYLLADRDPSVTVGVVSAVGRDVRPEGDESREQVWSNMIQTDAAINPGNSGGPLVNARGEVIGVNAFIFSGGTGGSIGLGFAIPIDRVKRVLGDVVEFGEIRRPWTGLHLSTPPNRNGLASRGARVVRVDPRSPAERAGIQPGDLVIATEGRPLQSALEWEGRLLDLPSGEPIAVEIEREGRAFEVELLPADDPLRTASRIATPFGAELVVVTPTLASRLDLRSPSGLLVAEMEIDSALRRLQLGEGDVLLAIGDRRLDTADDVELVIETLRSGRPFTLYYEQNGAVRRFCYRMMC